MDSILSISTSALTAQRANLDIIAGNIANKDVTRDEAGNPVPYRRRVALFAPGNPADGPGAPGVHIASVVQDPSPFQLVEEPNHPDAIKEGRLKGFVQYPNVNYHTEMVNAITAVRAYEANVTVIEAAKRVASQSLRLLA